MKRIIAMALVIAMCLCVPAYAAVDINTEVAKLEQSKVVSLAFKGVTEYELGDKGKYVTNINTYLRKWGYGTMKGSKFTAETEHWVTTFQYANGFTVTGTVDRTLYAVLKSSSGAMKYATYCRLMGWLIKGDTGSKVQTLQQMLRHAGYYRGKIDGVFGSVLQASVKKAAKKFGLTYSMGEADDSFMEALIYECSETDSLADGRETINYIMQYLSKYIGKKFTSGAKGFFSIFKKYGVTIPNSNAGVYKSKAGQRVEDIEDIKTGDIICFYDKKLKLPYKHVAMYIGNAKYICVNPKTGKLETFNFLQYNAAAPDRTQFAVALRFVQNDNLTAKAEGWL